MARIQTPRVAAAYETCVAFRADCLLRDGSLLFPDEAIWSPGTLGRLHADFVDSPDESARLFLDKLKDQIGKAGPEVIALAAEVLCVYFLFPSNVGGEKKKEVVNQVLGWAGRSLPEEHMMMKAFAHGIGSGGYGYNTRRPFELWYLINLAIAWKKQPPDVQLRAASDPWMFMAFADRVPDAESRQLRHMLLHLLFPDQFERIASGAHKRRVAHAFAALAPSTNPSDENQDRQLLAIREALAPLLPGHELDFYESPLVEAWGADDYGDGKAPSPELLRHKKQVVLYGPPGTGKTFRAKQLAERVIRSAALAKWGAPAYFQSEPRLKKLVADHVHRLQLHPAFSYEDFVRALHISRDGSTEFRPGYLPRLIELIEREAPQDRLPHVLILDEMNRTDLSRMLGECFSLLEDRTERVDLPGHDGQGNGMTLRVPADLYLIGTMNLIDQSVEQLDFALRRRFLWYFCPFEAQAFLEASEWRWNQRNAGVAWDRVEGDFRRLAGAAQQLNHQIEESPQLGGQYQIGHTYLLDVVAFLADALPSTTRASTFLWNRAGAALEPVQQLWDLSLKPLLEQYLAGLAEADRTNELKRLHKAFTKAAEPS